MAQIIYDMRNSLEMVGGSIGMTALFLAGLVALWYAKYDNKKDIGNLYIYAIASLLLVIEPAYYWLVAKNIPELALDNRYLWIVPTVPVILYAGVNAIGMLEDFPKKIMFSLGLVGVVVLAAATSYTKSTVNIGYQYISQHNEEVFSYILRQVEDGDREYALIWSEKAVMEYARKYDGRLHTLYGKDETENNSYNMVEYTPGHETEVSTLGYINDCDYIIISKNDYDEAGMEAPESMGRYFLEYTDGHYLVYVLLDGGMKD